MAFSSLTPLGEAECEQMLTGESVVVLAEELEESVAPIPRWEEAGTDRRWSQARPQEPRAR